jgi:hypothetical protein
MRQAPGMAFTGLNRPFIKPAQTAGIRQTERPNLVTPSGVRSKRSHQSEPLPSARLGRTADIQCKQSVN